MIVRKGIRLACLGALAGVTRAASAARVLQSLLYETAAIDALSYVAAALFVLLVATTAAWLPARRAAAVTAVTALREN